MLTETEIRAIARDEFKKLLMQGLGEINDNASEFLPTAEACKVLGYNNSKKLLKAVDNGLFRINKEVQDRRGNKSPRAKYYFNIKACLKRLNTPVEKRKS